MEMFEIEIGIGIDFENGIGIDFENGIGIEKRHRHQRARAASNPRPQQLPQAAVWTAHWFVTRI